MATSPVEEEIFRYKHRGKDNAICLVEQLKTPLINCQIFISIKKGILFRIIKLT